MTSFRVKKFDPRNIKPHRIMFLIGKRSTGKSVLMVDILSQMPKPDYVLAMSPTDETLSTFRKFLPEACIFSQFSQEKLERLLCLQRELIRRGKHRSVMIILDDCLYQKNVLKSTAMRDLFFNGRHLNVGLIAAAQYMMDLSCELRTNVDYLCTMRENTLTNRQKLHKHFFGQFGRFEEFDKVMSACTQNFSSLILDGTIASTVASDSVFWYRANLHPEPFRLCKPVYWGLSKKCGRSEEELLREQAAQFELETAAAAGQQEKGGAARVTVVQTEDENGKVISST